MDERERLDLIAAHCLAARELIAQTDDKFLRHLLNMVLLEVGTQLGQALSAAGYVPQECGPSRSDRNVVNLPRRQVR